MDIRFSALVAAARRRLRVSESRGVRGSCGRHVQAGFLSGVRGEFAWDFSWGTLEESSQQYITRTTMMINMG